MNTMRALCLQDGQLKLDKNYPVPDLKPGQALIKVKHAGICGTDLQLVRGLYGFNGVLGHEFVGVVETVLLPSESEEDLPDYFAFSRDWIDQVVVGEINVSCGQCATCLNSPGGISKHCEQRTVPGIRGCDGTFADYLALPLNNLHRVPVGIDLELLTLTEPLAAAFDILEKVRINSGHSVLVVGDGRMGQLCARVLTTTGCKVSVLGKYQSKLDKLPSTAEQLLISKSIDRKFDTVIECSGAISGMEMALDRVRPQGVIILKSTFEESIKLPASKIVVDEISVIGSRCGNFEKALHYISANSDSLKVLIQARFSIDVALQAFEFIGKEKPIKVILNMD